MLTKQSYGYKNKRRRAQLLAKYK